MAWLFENSKHPLLIKVCLISSFVVLFSSQPVAFSQQIEDEFQTEDLAKKFENYSAVIFDNAIKRNAEFNKRSIQRPNTYLAVTLLETAAQRIREGRITFADDANWRRPAFFRTIFRQTLEIEMVEERNPKLLGFYRTLLSVANQKALATANLMTFEDRESIARAMVDMLSHIATTTISKSAVEKLNYDSMIDGLPRDSLAQLQKWGLAGLNYQDQIWKEWYLYHLPEDLPQFYSRIPVDISMRPNPISRLKNSIENRDSGLKELAIDIVNQMAQSPTDPIISKYDFTARIKIVSQILKNKPVSLKHMKLPPDIFLPQEAFEIFWNATLENLRMRIPTDRLDPSMKDIFIEKFEYLTRQGPSSLPWAKYIFEKMIESIRNDTFTPRRNLALPIIYDVGTLLNAQDIVRDYLRRHGGVDPAIKDQFTRLARVARGKKQKRILTHRENFLLSKGQRYILSALAMGDGKNFMEFAYKKMNSENPEIWETLKQLGVITRDNKGDFILSREWATANLTPESRTAGAPQLRIADTSKPSTHHDEGIHTDPHRFLFPQRCRSTASKIVGASGFARTARSPD
ncbi:MAG: hypothetical protein J0L93_00700 [Deltaproteobacteria bacterium]|nr:hypothetical protein [Deltaproteobacteria bacterium]